MKCQVCNDRDWEYAIPCPGLGHVDVCSICAEKVKHVLDNQRVMVSSLADLIALARLVLCGEPLSGTDPAPC